MRGWPSSATAIAKAEAAAAAKAAEKAAHDAAIAAQTAAAAAAAEAAEAAKAAETRRYCTSEQALVALSALNVKSSSGGSFSKDFRTYRHTDESTRCEVNFDVTWVPLSGHAFLPPTQGEMTSTIFYYKKDRRGFTNLSPIYRPLNADAPTAEVFGEIYVFGQGRGDSGTTDDTCGGQVVLRARQVQMVCVPILMP